MISATLRPVLPAAHLDQSDEAHRVQQKGHADGQEPRQGEEQGEGLVAPLEANVEETPGARELDVVASQAHDRQQSDEAGEQPHRQHHGDGPTLGHGGEARKRAIDADEPLHGHGGAEQQRAKAIKHHGHPHEVAEVAVWVQVTPVEARQMEGNHDGPRDQETGKVRDHQATQENQERGSGSAVGPVEGLGQNYESNEVGDEAQSAEDGRKVNRGDDTLLFEGGAVDGVAERGVVGGGRGVHGGGVGGLEHHLSVMCFISLPNPEDKKRGNIFWGVLRRYSCEKPKKK